MANEDIFQGAVYIEHGNLEINDYPLTLIILDPIILTPRGRETQFTAKMVKPLQLKGVEGQKDTFKFLAKVEGIDGGNRVHFQPLRVLVIPQGEVVIWPKTEFDRFFLPYRAAP